MTHEVVDMKDFNEWWDSDIIRSSPFRRGSPKYWAWAAWEAALREHAMSEVQRLGQEIQPEQQPLEYWNAVEGWVRIDEVREHLDSVGCGTIYKTSGEDRVPLYTTPHQRTWVGLTDEEKNKMAFIAGSDKHWLIRLVENKLKEHNT